MLRTSLIAMACVGAMAVGPAAAGDDGVADYGGWTGFSVGVGVGAGMLSSEVDVRAVRRDDIGIFIPGGGDIVGELPDLPIVGDILEGGINIPILGFLQTAGVNLEDAGNVGFFGTIQVAYDHQVSDRFVVGAFVDADWASEMDSNFNVSGSTELRVLGDLIDIPISASSVNGSIEQDWAVTLGGRIGWLATPSTMFYVLAAYTHVELDNPQLQVNFTNLLDVVADFVPGLLDAGGPINARFSDSLDGYTIGAGVETKLSRAVSLKFEYRYTDLEEATASVSRTDFSEPILEIVSLRRVQDEVEATIDPDIHSVRAVLSYKFNREEPPAYEPLK